MASFPLARRLAPLALAPLLWAAAALPASAEEPRSSIQHVGPAAANAAASPQACAADYHTRLETIRRTRLAAYREAEIAIGTVDPALPGRLLFDAGRRPDLEADARRALSAANALARRQGRSSFARDANTRWIAGRIREDLTDYLSQKPTPFLCAGLSPYLAKLREYAVQGAPSPDGLAEDAQVQRRVASRSLDAAFRAMRPAPKPRFAPADRPQGPGVEDLRLALEVGFDRADAEGEPTRLAEGRGESRISESRIDPDLPPIDPKAERRLDSAADLSRAITALMLTAAREGFIPQAGPLDASSPADDARPVLARLAALRAHLDGPQGRIEDRIVSAGIERALSDLEALDYLIAASNGSGDPLTDAMYGTMSAIEAAHSEACTCSN